MNKYNRQLAIQQLDQRLSQFHGISEIGLPPSGWIHAIRSALGMSLTQLARRLGKSVASVKEIEERERSQAITLRKLSEVAEALDLQLVYALIPKGGSLAALIERRSMELAREIVLRTSHSMALEDQQNSDARLQQAIREKAEELRREAPKMLWN